MEQNVEEAKRIQKQEKDYLYEILGGESVAKAKKMVA